MYTLTKQFRFEAAHQLPHHEGKCRRLHGHSWIMEVEVSGEMLQPTGSSMGMLMDFVDIGRQVQLLLEGTLDHYYLNDTTGLQSPTSENLAYYIYWRLKPAIPGLSAITIHETCTSACTYRESPNEDH